MDSSPFTRIGFGGSRGGSKSHGARAIALLFGLKHAGVPILIFRRTFDELWANHIQPLFKQYSFMRDWYNTQHKELTLPNGSRIRFGYAEHPGDIDQFQGQEFALIIPDEATKLTEEEHNKLEMCNRCTIPGVTPKMVDTMNPGGPGHMFIKRRYLDRKFHEREKPENYVFIQAYGWDNIEWVRGELEREGLTEQDYYFRFTEEQRFQYFIRNSAYGRTLDAMPGKLRVGHLMGRWDVFAGQYFDIWEPQKMTRRVEQMGLKDWFPRWISVDWGFEHNSAAHWHAAGNGKTWTYREFMTNHTAPRDLALEIVNRCKSGANGTEKREAIDAIYLSPDAFAKRTSEDTVAHQMSKVFREHGLPEVSPADNDRIGGWQLMYQMLADGTWVIGDNCHALIENLPALTRDEEKVEDCEKTLNDDAPDSVRYGLKSRQRPTSPPLEERVKKHLTAKDPSIKMLQLQEALAKEAGPVFVRRKAGMHSRWVRN